jgi:pilus assembly protein CpaB
VTKDKGRLFMMAAIVLAAGAAVVGYLSLRQVADRVATDQGRGFRPVVVTMTELTYGVKLERSMLQVVSYPKGSVPDGAYSDVDSVLSQTTKVFMGAREPVTATKLSSRGGGLSMLVRPNMRAAGLQVNQVSGVSGFILPGDRVDVLATVDRNMAGQEAITRTVLQNIEVLAAGQKTEQRDNKPITVQAVTLLVDPTGAEVLAHSQHEGEISLVLRNPDDQTQVATPAMSNSGMLGPGPSKPAATRSPRPSNAQVASTPAPTSQKLGPQKIRIIRSANVTETPAVPDSSGK